MFEKVTEYLGSPNPENLENRGSEIPFSNAVWLLSESETRELQINGETVQTDSIIDDLKQLHDSRQNNPRFETEIEETARGAEGTISTGYDAGSYEESLPDRFRGKLKVQVEFEAEDYSQLNYIIDQ